MLVVNRTRQKIGSHQHGFFLRPGSNDVDETKLTKSERVMLKALEKAGAIECRDAPPESGSHAITMLEEEIAAAIASPPAEGASRPMKTRKARR